MIRIGGTLVNPAHIMRAEVSTRWSASSARAGEGKMDPYEQGEAAYHEGKLPSANPYPPGDDHDEWDEGYEGAQVEDEGDE